MCFFCKKSLFYLFLFYTIFGFFVIPALLKPQLLKSVDESLNAKISIETLSFNPFIFKLSMDNVTLYDLEKKPLVSFESFFINIDPSSLLYGTLHLQEFSLVKPHIYLNNSKSKGINLLNIIKPSIETDKTEEDRQAVTLPRIIIEKISLREGSFSIEDSTREKLFTFSVENIGFKLEDIDTKELNTQDASLRFYSHLGDGGFIDFRANIVGLEPLKVEGSLDFEASQLYTEYRYIQENLNIEVADGKISFHSLYSFDSGDLNATAIKNLEVSIDKLRIKPKNRESDILTLKKFSLSQGEIYPLAEKGTIESLAVQELHVKVQRDEEKKIDWIEYIKVNKDEDSKRSEQSIATQESKWQFIVKKLALEKISLEFEDSAVEPHVSTKIKKFDFYAKDITLAGKRPITYNLLLDANEKFHCKAAGTLIHKHLNLSLAAECKDLDIVHYKPYIDQIAKKSLSVYDIELQRAIAGLSFNVEVKELDDNKTEIILNNSSMYIDDIKLAKESTEEKILSLKHMGIENISFNSSEQKSDIELFLVEGLNLNTKRYKSGKLNIENIVVPHKDKKSKKIESDKAVFALSLENFVLKNANVDFEDDFLSKRVKNTLRKINFNAKNISLEKDTFLDYSLSMFVNKKGKIKSRGKLQHTPLKQEGSFSISNLALTPLTPYLQESSYVAIKDGRVSLNGKLSYVVSKKRPDLRVESSFLLESFFVNNSKDKSALLSVNDVKTDQFTLELTPNRFYINELNVNSFYVNALIDQNRTMNFQKLLKKSAKTASPKKVEEKEKNPFPVKILKVNVRLGSAKFADYSIPIQFSTHIHNLNGVLYSLSNVQNDTTYVDIVGDVDEYGSTSLRGSLDGSDPLAYTDLAFSFKNLDMHSLSGYSATFAGHEIDGGKLYLDLGYEILNSEMIGSNSIIMKKIVLGKEIDDENVTVLPLGFVFGLLEDSDGVIDIDMPVEGNVDNPDFKYGALILNTIGGLVAKAITSPFKFLGDVMGFDAEAIKFVLFEPARTVISPPEREKLDQVYKIMLKKPKISLAISGSYDEVLDTKALKIDLLIDRVMEKSGLKNRQEHESAMSVSLLEDIYEDMRDDDYLNTLEDELKADSDEDFERRYYNALLDHCIDIQVVEKSTLIELANKRADAMINYLVKEKGIVFSRVERLEAKSSQSEGEKMVKVDLHIEVK